MLLLVLLCLRFEFGWSEGCQAVGLALYRSVGPDD